MNPPNPLNNAPPTDNPTNITQASITTRVAQKILNKLLCAAVYFNWQWEVELFIAYGANVNCVLTKSHGNTPLHIAAMRSNKAMAEYLVNQGASKNTQNKKGQRPYEFAAEHSDLWHYLHVQENLQIG